MARIVTPAPAWNAPNALFRKVYEEARSYALSCARVEIADRVIRMGFVSDSYGASLYPYPWANPRAYRRDRERIAKARAEARRNAKIRRFQREYLRSIDWEAAA